MEKHDNPNNLMEFSFSFASCFLAFKDVGLYVIEATLLMECSLISWKLKSVEQKKDGFVYVNSHCICLLPMLI